MLLTHMIYRTHFRKLSFQRATKVSVQQMNTQATMMTTAQPSLPRLQYRWRTLAEQPTNRIASCLGLGILQQPC